MATDDPARDARADYTALLSLAAHELRTPASVLAGYLRMLRDGDPPPTPRQRRMIDEAERSCARVTELAAQLSDLSKIDTGIAPFATDPFDLFTAAGAATGNTDEGRDAGVSIEARGAASGAPLVGDAASMRTALTELVRAVLREQVVAGTLAIDRRLIPTGHGSEATIVIARSEEVEDALRAPAGPFDDRRGGLGMALPLARRVIARHGGRVWSPAGRSAQQPGCGPIIVAIPINP